MNARWVGIMLAGWIGAVGWGVPSAAAQTRILCIGDSITYGYGVSVSYPTRLRNNTGLDVINAGVRGMWASYGYKHVDEWLAQYHPTHVLILFGTNDTNDPYQDYRNAAETVMKTARKVKAVGAIPIVGTIPPKIGPRAYQMSRVREFNDYLRSRAASEGILLADIQAAFGSGSGLFLSDGFHPNDSGAEVIARTFAQKIQILSLDPASVEVPDTGAQGRSIQVTSKRAWTVGVNQPWIYLTSGAAGLGNGTITFGVAANTGPARTGLITVSSSEGTRSCAVKQAAATLVLSPVKFFAPASGAVRRISVVSHFPWTATTSDSRWLQIVSGSAGAANGIVTLRIAPNAGLARTGLLRVTIGGTTRYAVVYQWAAATWDSAPTADYDGDRAAEPATFQAAQGNWRVLFNDGKVWGFRFGWPAVVPVPADYDGDGLVDFAVYHPRAGNWHVLHSSDGVTTIEPFGWQTTIPLPGDYDGDGIADFVVFHRPTARWYFRYSADGRNYNVGFGWPSVVPVPADYDGDGATDIAVYNPNRGGWYVSTRGVFQLGGGKALPVPADYDGDGRADLAVFTRANAQWDILKSGGGRWTVRYGWPGVFPVPADYDGDGKTDLAVYYPAGGKWYLRSSLTGRTVEKTLGGPDQQPVLQHTLIHSWFGMY